MTTSVALCTYNGEKYLREQLDSILNQSFPVDEIVVCDDGSKDATLKILEEYKSKYPKIFKIHRNKENVGYVRNFEQAINLCIGEVIFLCDQDDVWHTDKVYKTINYFNNHPKKLVCAHNLNLIGNINTNGKTYWEIRNFNPELNNEDILRQTLFSANYFPGMSMALKKECKRWLPFKKINPIIIHDFELVINACKQNGFGVINEVLADYRLHDQQNIGFGIIERKETISEKDIYNRYLGIANTTEIINTFGLNPVFIEEHKNLFADYLKQYLHQFNPVERIFKSLKVKYYYKISL